MSFLLKHCNRIVGLDIIRSLAILIVLYEHGMYLLPIQLHESYLNFLVIKTDAATMFFVLSGFLIGVILIKLINSTKFTLNDLLNFWIRRWFRTIPNYIFVILFILIYRWLVFNNFGDFNGNLKYFLFVQNFSSPHPIFFPEAWTLSIEEWFYLLYPLCCYIFYKLIKNKGRSLLISTLLFLIIPLILRIAKYQLGIYNHDLDLEFRKIVLLRLDSVMYGIIASYLYINFTNNWKKYKVQLLILGIIFCILLYFNPVNWREFYPPIVYNIDSITVFCFLPFLSSFNSTKIKIIDKSIIFLSIISYSMYLLNLNVVQRSLLPYTIYILKKINISIETNYIVLYIVFWLYTIFFSYVLYTFFEKPVTDLRDKFKSK